MIVLTLLSRVFSRWGPLLLFVLRRRTDAVRISREGELQEKTKSRNEFQATAAAATTIVSEEKKRGKRGRTENKRREREKKKKM